jgi:phosphoglycerate dehydrogenase-like enzyme
VKVIFLNPVEERLKEFPGRYLPAPEFETFVPGADGGLPDDLGDFEAAVYWSASVDRDLIDRMPGLRLIQRVGQYRGGGELSAAYDRGVIVSVTPYGVLARVAQHTLSMMLMLARQMVPSHQAVVDGTNTIGMQPEYAKERPVAFNWAGIQSIGSLYDKTLGIVGFGEAGSVLAQLVQPFDMEVLYYKRRRLTPGQERFYGVEFAELDELLGRSDYVASFVPYLDENRGMLGEREFGLMKPGSYFVNTGRANTTDEQALIRALSNGRLAGAGLDVFSYEPLPNDTPFRDQPNVVLTPHTAGGVGGWVDTFERIARNLRLVRDGSLPVGYFSRDAFEL